MPSKPPVATYPSPLLSLITSSTYPVTPTLEELEALRVALQQQVSSNAIRLAESDPAERERLKKERKERKRKEREREENEERERAALEANERAGQRLEAIERARTGSASVALGTPGKQGSPAGVRIKRERTSISPAPSNASSASFRPTPTHAAPITYGSGQLKKKKKRVVDSDDERSARDRSTTLGSPPSHHAPYNTTSTLKIKMPQAKSRPSTTHVEPSPTPSAPTPSALPGSSIDFSLPGQPSRPLIPPRPGVQKPMKPGPKKQSEVSADYSQTKVPSQVGFPTWWNTVEPYIREIREEDLAMLTLKASGILPTADAPESYEIPARGRHYTEVWDEEDHAPGSNPRVSVPNMRQMYSGPSQGALAVPHFVPAAEMRDELLVDEHRGLGALTERVVAAVVGESQDTDVEGKSADHIESGGEAGKVDVVDLEERMKKELRAVMLLGEHEEFDHANRDDDEITSSLRQCQRLLLQQTGINEQRKARLAEIARHRLAFAEYQTALDGIEKAIEAGWARRVKKHGLGTKQRSSGSGAAGSSGRPPVPEHLKKLVQMRNNWLQSVGLCMRERPKGEVMGMPTHSVYEGIGDDEERDEKTVEDVVEVDEMDVDEVDGVA